jgi:hypothetical protein
MPTESPDAQIVPGSPPLLTLLGHLVAAAARSPALSSRAVRVKGVEPLPDGLAISANADGVNLLVDGTYRVELVVLHTSRESSLCDVHIAEGRALGKLVNWGIKLVPNPFLNNLLRGKAGGAIQLEGDRVVIDHRALVAWLLKN